MRCAHHTFLAPIAWIGQWTDSGVWLVFPDWSERTYWGEHAKAAHKMYANKCPGGVGKHVFGTHGYPKAVDLPGTGRVTWISGY